MVLRSARLSTSSLQRRSLHFDLTRKRALLPALAPLPSRPWEATARKEFSESARAAASNAAEGAVDIQGTVMDDRIPVTVRMITKAYSSQVA